MNHKAAKRTIPWNTCQAGYNIGAMMLQCTSTLQQLERDWIYTHSVNAGPDFWAGTLTVSSVQERAGQHTMFEYVY